MTVRKFIKSELVQRYAPGAQTIAEALSRYQSPLDHVLPTDLLTQHYSDLTREYRPPDERIASLRLLIGAIDLTTLEGTDTPGRITDLCQQAIDPAPQLAAPHTAAVCVYPAFVGLAAKLLSGSGVKVASVAGGFPAGQTLLKVKKLEVAGCVAAGADEIDIVLNRGAFLAGDYESVFLELCALRAAAGEATLKVILENCELPGPEAIYQASLLAMLAGADFIKTSTGKGRSGAALADVVVMVEAIADFHRHTGRFVGLKAAGGVTVEMAQAITYALVKLGSGARDPDRFRLGASSLLEKLLLELRVTQGRT
jgi:deoxyribose-phosphate aldolase